MSRAIDFLYHSIIRGLRLESSLHSLRFAQMLLAIIKGADETAVVGFWGLKGASSTAGYVEVGYKESRKYTF